MVKTQIKKIIWIYFLAFILVAFSFHAEAKKDSSAVPTAATKDKHPIVVMKTSMGTIEIKLNGEKAPITTENFMKYVDEKFYNGTIFHRVIDGFMIQGGGFTADLNEKPTREKIENEAKNGLSNKRGTIAMARTNKIHSATSQFFINVVDNSKLDYKSDDSYGYAVFGEVVKGMDVVDKIKIAQTGLKNGMTDVPTQNIVIESVTRK